MDGKQPGKATQEEENIEAAPIIHAVEVRDRHDEAGHDEEERDLRLEYRYFSYQYTGT